MALFGHHAEGFLEIEIMGRAFPDGPTEHVLALAVATGCLMLMLYGVVAMVRDYRRWRRGLGR